MFSGITVCHLNAVDDDVRLSERRRKTSFVSITSVTMKGVDLANTHASRFCFLFLHSLNCPVNIGTDSCMCTSSEGGEFKGG